MKKMPDLPGLAEVTIRKMRAEDLPRVTEILAHWKMAPRPATPELPDVESTGLETLGAAIVAVVGGRVVGSASYTLHSERRAETGSLAVDPAWRGTGIGARLQRARLAELKSLGVEEVFTETDRPEVVDWYVRKFGYRIAGTRRKKHAFSLSDVDRWTVLELCLRDWRPEN
jgi:N-acetylglutamate synthase-like GNAT family acetyltransferase